MTRLVNFIVMAAFAASLSACATPAPQPEAQNYAPPRAKLDAKTQLETGRQYR